MARSLVLYSAQACSRAREHPSAGRRWEEVVDIASHGRRIRLHGLWRETGVGANPPYVDRRAGFRRPALSVVGAQDR